jgi:site-specific recombinase XerD/predicted RNase H-like HicB family nuclease
LTLVKSEPSVLARLVEDYLAHCRAAGLSPKTIRHAYGYPLRSVLVPWCADHGVEKPEQLTSRTLDRFVADLLEHGGKRGQLSKHSVWSYAKATKGFVAWAKAEGEKVEGQIQLPRLPKKLVDTLSREEIQRLEESATSERDALMVRVLADSGIRVGELVKLRLGDFADADRQHFLKVRGKGSRERLVPISPALYRRLQRYADRQRPVDAVSDQLFLSRRRSRLTGDYEPLTESGVQQFVRDLGERAGLKQRVHPHLFRHSAASHMLRRGMNPLLVAPGSRAHLAGHDPERVLAPDSHGCSSRADVGSERRGLAARLAAAAADHRSGCHSRAPAGRLGRSAPKGQSHPAPPSGSPGTGDGAGPRRRRPEAQDPVLDPRPGRDHGRRVSGSAVMSSPVRTYSIVVDPDPEGGYTVTVPALPGCITQGETIDECIANAKEAIALYLEDLTASGEPVPEEKERPQLLQVTVAA